MCFFIEKIKKICYNKKENINKERTEKMNKIYNNLTIENLIKTDWINQFNELQQKQIRMGLFFDLNVSKYANPKFNEYQMEEIRRGLEDDLDVSLYAKPDFSDWKMKEIREKLFKEKIKTIGFFV